MAKARDKSSLFASFSMEDQPEVFSKPAAKSSGKAIRKTVHPSQLIPNKHNRYNMKRDEEYEELLRIMKKDGFTNPILVKPADENGNYEIYSGHRRRMAAMELGLEKVTIEIKAQELKKSEEIAYIGRGNGGARQKYPYDNALQIKNYYAALDEEGDYTDAQKKEMVIDGFGISSERTYYNYDNLSILPEEVLIWGQNGFLTRDQGLALSKGYKSDMYRRITNTAIDALREIISDETLDNAQKSEKIKARLKEFDKALNRKDDIEEQKALAPKSKKLKLSAAMTKIDKIIVAELEMPSSAKDKQKAEDLIDKAIEKLMEYKNRLNG